MTGTPDSTTVVRGDPLKRGNNFDAIRLGLALLVVCSHSYPLGTGSEAGEPIAVLTRRQATGGAIAVDLFFVISGFLITASLERCGSVLEYLRRRVRRIYPGFLVASLFGLVLALTLAHATLRSSAPGMVLVDFGWRTLRLLEFHHSHAFAGNPYPDAINGSLWSVSYEFWCYIGVAGLGLAGWLRNRRMLLGVFAASMLARVLFEVLGWSPYGGVFGRVFGTPALWARLLPLYLAGVVVYAFRARLTFTGRGALGALGALAVAARLPHGWAALWPLAGAYLVFYAAFQDRVRLHGFARRGDFSYGTYLYAFPVQQIIVRLAGHPLAPSLLAALAIPATLGLAVASWVLVERRFLRRGRRAATPQSDGVLLARAQGS